NTQQRQDEIAPLLHVITPIEQFEKRGQKNNRQYEENDRVLNYALHPYGPLAQTNCSMSAMILALILGAPLGRAQQAVGTLIVEVRSGSSPAEQVEIQAVGIQTVTNNRGEASLELPAGPVEVRLQRFGFVS